MAIANGTRVSFCNQPKAHYLASSRESRRYVVAVAGIWLRQEILRHILASPGYAPRTFAISFIWMEREFNACQTHRSMYTSIFNRFPVIQPEISNVRHFRTFFAHFCLPWVRPWDNRGKGYRIEREFNACQTPRSMYPSIFNRFPVIQPVILKVRHFSTFFAHFCLPWVHPGTITVNVTRL